MSDTELADTYGPQWRAVCLLLDRVATLSDDEAELLRDAWRGAQDSAWGTAWDAAQDAAWDAVRDSAWHTARDTAGGAALDVAQYPGCGAVWDALLAVVIWDLATSDGPYTIRHRDLLMKPWREVCGLPDGLLERDMT